MQNEKLLLHQSQQSVMQMKDSACLSHKPLLGHQRKCCPSSVWVENASGHLEFPEACDGPKSTTNLDTAVAGAVPSGAASCFGSKKLQLLGSFLRASMEYSKQVVLA